MAIKLESQDDSAASHVCTSHHTRPSSDRIDPCTRHGTRITVPSYLLWQWQGTWTPGEARRHETGETDNPRYLIKLCQLRASRLSHRAYRKDKFYSGCDQNCQIIQVFLEVAQRAGSVGYLRQRVIRRKAEGGAGAKFRCRLPHLQQRFGLRSRVPVFCRGIEDDRQLVQAAVDERRRNMRVALSQRQGYPIYFS